MPIDLSSRDERELVRDAQRELPYVTLAYSELMRRYEARLLRFCRRFLHDQHDQAEDVCQEAMLRAFHGLKSFEGRSSFKNWLYKITYHSLVSYQRRSDRERALRVDVDPLELLSEAADGGSDPAETDEAARLLQALSAADREILVLRHEAGLEIREIAEILGIGLSAAKMRLYRAAEALERELNRRN